MRNILNALIVDDNALVCWALARIISKQGYKATTVSNGKDALTEIGRSPYNIVVLELDLPDMDGLDILEEIKKAAPEAKVIIMAADLAKKIRKKAMALGVLHFLEKPFTSDDIIHIIKNMPFSGMEQKQDFDELVKSQKVCHCERNEAIS